uniref:Uncharacterized protein n=1 Tax=Rhizophora mucronata TaxID=61149 RepID=A0A2P2MU64_RHIMU
MGLYRFDNRN